MPRPPTARIWTRRSLLAALVPAPALASRRKAPPLAEPRLLLTWGKKGDRPGEFFSPISLAVTPRDELYVTDLNNARVQKFTSQGDFLSSFDLPLDAPPRKSCIIGGMALDREGLIYVSFMVQNKIAVYDPAGKVVREWGRRGSGNGELWQPGGIVIRPDGTLFVADQCNHRVQHFTLEGRFLGQWGGHGSLPGRFGGPEPAGSRFAGPHFLAQDRRGRLYTTEGVLGRIQQLTPEGRPLAAWGSKGSEPGGFGALATPFSRVTFGPIGVMVDLWDRVWVTSLNDRVQCFTPEGRFLFAVGSPGKEPGQWARPHGMAMDSRGHLYVADAGNERIQKLEVPVPRVPADRAGGPGDE
jgi:tripartite motif-containing protein 71